MLKTWVKKVKEVQRDWKIIDAKDQALGRLASHVANLLIGKSKADYTPHVMGGDFVIVINSNQVKLTGKKWSQKKYYTKSRFVGSLKEKLAKDLSSEELIRHAVGGMLPKNTHRPRALKRLKIFKDSSHNYEDKKPTAFTI
ncbi:MAG: 50S ribosomal protein L13 [Bdellovibrionaceae bacterium]|nr:50S ribosomal protein L13 [Pseudobdellovibrionaceae bacterium]